MCLPFKPADRDNCLGFFLNPVLGVLRWKLFAFPPFQFEVLLTMPDKRSSMSALTSGCCLLHACSLSNPNALLLTGRTVYLPSYCPRFLLPPTLSLLSQQGFGGPRLTAGPWIIPFGNLPIICWWTLVSAALQTAAVLQAGVWWLMVRPQCCSHQAGVTGQNIM